MRVLEPVRVTLLRGPSAGRLISLIYLAGAVQLAIIAIGLVALSRMGPTIAVQLLLWGWVMTVVISGAVLPLLAIRRRNQEIAAGYTTALINPDIADVDTVDDRTGIVLRKAGEPPLTRTQFAKARAEARLILASK